MAVNKNSAKQEGDSVKSLVGLLFAVPDPLSRKRILRLTGILEKDWEMVLNLAREKLEVLGLKILEQEKRYQLVVFGEAAAMLRKVTKDQENDRLGKASFEILTIIAYLGGATKDEVELVRGVNSSQGLRNLLVKGLIEKKKNVLGARYLPTLLFLKCAGVERLEDLPDFDKLNQSEEIKAFIEYQKEQKEE